MKKKGLIISTVVMVVVLIASLTTATYAWFTTSASVQVNPIDLSVKSSANVKVGVKADPTAVTSGYDAYLNGSVTVADGTTGNAVKWDGETPGLGSVLTFEELALGGDKAVGIGVPYDAANAETTGTVTNDMSILNPASGNSIIVARGKGSTVTKDTIALANANKDYLDATIGVQANQEGIKGMYVRVDVTTNDSQSLALGVCASIHFIIQIGDKSYEFEPFGVSTRTTDESTGEVTVSGTTKDTVKKNMSGKGITVVGEECKSTFYFWVAANETTAFAQDETAIKDFRILAYISGADPDCAERVTGGCTIEIAFDGTKDLDNIKNPEGTADVAVADLVFLNNIDLTAK